MSSVANSCLPLWDPMDCVAHHAPLSMGSSRQAYWNGLPFSSPGDPPNPGIKLQSPTLQADSLPLSHLESPSKIALLTSTHYSLVLVFSSTSITVCNYINFLLTCWSFSPLRCNLYGQKDFCLSYLLLNHNAKKGAWHIQVTLLSTWRMNEWISE